MNTAPLTSQTTTARRAAEAEVRRLVARFAPGHAALVRAVRRSLRGRLPTAHEVVYAYRDCLVISFSASPRGHEGVLALRASASGVKLYVTRANDLPDPAKRLRGSGKQARWIALEDASALTDPAVAHLVDVAIACSRVPFAASGREPVVIRQAPRGRPPTRSH